MKFHATQAMNFSSQTKFYSFYIHPISPNGIPTMKIPNTRFIDALSWHLANNANSTTAVKFELPTAFKIVKYI